MYFHPSLPWSIAVNCGPWIFGEVTQGGYIVTPVVVRSGATAVFTLTARPGLRARLVIRPARHHQKPWLHIHRRTRLPAMMLASMVGWNRVTPLHVSGSTEREEPGINGFVHQILEQAAAFLPMECATRPSQKPAKLRQSTGLGWKKFSISHGTAASPFRSCWCTETESATSKANWLP